MPVGLSPPQLRIALAIVVCAIAAHALGLLGDGFPTPRSPYPIALTVIMFLGVPALVPAVLMGLSFFVSSRRALNVAPKFSWAAALALSIATLASIAYFIAGWHYGVQYQGRPFVLICAWMSALAATALWVVFVLCWRKQARFGSLMFYFLLFSWLSTYAFPYFGEAP
jgi:hypothetical protein